MQRGLVGSEMCIRDRYQRRVHGNQGQLDISSRRESEYNSGKWEKEEQERLLEGIKNFGNQWAKVAELVKTRTQSQVRSHAQKHFLKMRRLEIERCKKDILHPKKIFAITREYLNRRSAPTLVLESVPETKKNKHEAQVGISSNERPQQKTPDLITPIPYYPIPKLCIYQYSSNSQMSAWNFQTFSPQFHQSYQHQY
eukprot:TRINITY_DN18261_c0_g1_i2.p1 TRINITY_DN18261_c0_g1~~TRINITY_DN18261_c0_g1_i2.p1  ORF type:complete len:197 (+),score=32.35 TRINITY_DN18261_c0_g1_i2:117-707(+)